MREARCRLRDEIENRNSKISLPSLVRQDRERVDLGRAFRRARRGPAFRTNTVTELHVRLPLQELFERNPVFMDIHLPAPGTDLNEAFEKAQPLKDPKRRAHDRDRHDQHGERFEPEFLWSQRRFECAEKAIGQVDVFVEPDERDHRAKTDQFESKNNLFVGVLFLNFHDLVS